MTARLGALASVIVRAGVIADVGCDHGEIAAYCADNGLAERVIASDISGKCLDKARAALSDRDNVRFVECDGICYECDEAVIAGMGGILICSILDRAEKAALLPGVLVLMPHRDEDKVRRKLVKLGYAICVDFTVKDRGRFYSVMRAERRDGAYKPTELQYLFGMNVDKRDEVLTERLEKLYNTYGVAPDRNAKILQNLREALLLQGVDVRAEDI